MDYFLERRMTDVQSAPLVRWWSVGGLERSFCETPLKSHLKAALLVFITDITSCPPSNSNTSLSDRVDSQLRDYRPENIYL